MLSSKVIQNPFYDLVSCKDEDPFVDKTDLIADPLIDSTSINIHIVQCDVVFSGAVNSIEQEKRALWYALHTDGVSKAYSFLHVLR